MKAHLLLLFFLFTIGCTHFQTESNCIENQGAWDFGSGTIKFLAAKVDRCEGRMLARLYYEDHPMGFKQDLSSSKNKVFSENIQTQALLLVEQLLENVKDLNLASHHGVATAAFREAKNASSFVNKLNTSHSLNINIIDQDEEAKIGVLSARSQVKGDVNQIIVWDIGGGSQQISKISNGEIKTYKSPWAAVSFKNQVLEKIKKAKKSKTPNPMTFTEWQKSVELAEKLAQVFAMNSQKGEDLVIYGIGGVHAAGIKSKLKGKASYSASDLRKIAKSLIGKTDAQIGGRYAATEVTNLALVIGTMQALGFSQVTPIKVGLVEGVLLSSLKADK